MAKLVTKFKYLKPNAHMSVGGYAKYIATREGVDKIDDSQKLLPATVNQQKLINKILNDFPDSKDSLEYEDYLQNRTIGSASEFISRTLEENADRMMDNKTYADYIATRPRAERFGSHGLFTDDGVQINLSKVSAELNLHGGNVWTAIVSLCREDAHRLGFDNGERWRDMLRTQTEALAANLKIPMENLRWFAAFHNESYHPHVHLIAYSTIENEGYLTKKGVNNLRSSFAKDIFEQDRLCVFDQQTVHRDNLKAESSNLIAEIISKINSGTYENPVVEEKLLHLANRLSKTGGKKVYGYLKADVKDIIDSIVDELAKDERVSDLYNLWYEQRENVLQIYSKNIPARIPLSQNDTFKSIRNTVIQEAMNILADHEIIDEVSDADFIEPEPPDDEAETMEPPPPFTEYDHIKAEAESGNKWSQYRFAKLLLDREDEYYNPKEAVNWLIESAKQNYTVAKYMLGKLFLRGDDVPKNVDYAMRWLEEAVDDKNQYAEYLLGKTLFRGVDIDQNLPRVEDLLTKSSDQGNKYAAYTLGKAYFDGDVMLQNIPEAIKRLEESAQKNFAPAQYILGKLLYKGEVTPQDIPKALGLLEKASVQDNPYAAYLAGKIRLTEESIKDVTKAIQNFKIAAKNGNDYAEYQLGKLYLYGKDVPRDEDLGISYLTSAAEHGNKYAAQLLHSMKSNKNWTAALGSLRLLGHLARLIQNRLENERRDNDGGIIDRKLRRKIEEKKQAHGLKH